VTGWLITRERYVDDEVKGFVPAWSSTGHCDDVLEAVGGEAPVATHITPDGGSPRG
jgi:CP family cyanate transporter-like MFS transporter